MPRIAQLWPAICFPAAAQLDSPPKPGPLPDHVHLHAPVVQTQTMLTRVCDHTLQDNAQLVVSTTAAWNTANTYTCCAASALKMG